MKVGIHHDILGDELSGEMKFGSQEMNFGAFVVPADAPGRVGFDKDVHCSGKPRIIRISVMEAIAKTKMLTCLREFDFSSASDFKTEAKAG